MIRREAACKHFAEQNLTAVRIHFARAEMRSWGPHQTGLMGRQVRLPISELKAYLTEKLAY